MNQGGDQRIVVRGANWLGDAVMTSPALLRLREAYPNAFIALVTPDKLGDLWNHHPAVNAVLPFDSTQGMTSIASRLRQEPFQTGLVFPNSFRSALELWLGRVPRRVGVTGQWRRWLLTDPIAPRPDLVRMRKRPPEEIRGLVSVRSGENPAGPIDTAVETGTKPPIPPGAHHIHHYLHLTAHLGANPRPLPPQIFVPAAEVDAFLHRFQIGQTPERPLFGLNPGAEYGPAKRWPADRFIAAAREVQKRTKCRWILFGGRGDLELTARIIAGIAPGIRDPGGPATGTEPVNLAGATSLRELCAGLKACQVVLTNDTGPMHLAAAVGTPVVALFGSTSPELTGPGLPGTPLHRLLRVPVPCAPCFLRECPIDFRCMNNLTVDTVVEAVLARSVRPSSDL